MKESKTVIEIKGVGKKFKRNRKVLLKEELIDLIRLRKTEEFWTLNNIDLTVMEGETLGIIGPNGSGKSTLLKIIAGVMEPDLGNINVVGNIAPMIELAAGFHPELTGRENIYVNGSILGLKRKEIDEKLQEIINFSELYDFIDTPVKHYSSGMYMRLGFSIIVQSNANIFLIDEILAVGDEQFQKKCLKKMNELKRKGKTIVFISHNLEIIKMFCSRVLYIDKGTIVDGGEPDKVVDHYINKSKFRKGDGSVKITNIVIENNKEIRSSIYKHGEDFYIKYCVNVNKDIIQPIFGIMIRNENNEEIMATNTLWNDMITDKYYKGEKLELIFKLRGSLTEGKYYVTPAVASNDLKLNYDWYSNMIEFKVVGQGNLVKQNSIISIKKI